MAFQVSLIENSAALSVLKDIAASIETHWPKKKLLRPILKEMLYENQSGLCLGIHSLAFGLLRNKCI